MKETAKAANNRGLLTALILLGLIACVAFLPSIFRSGSGKAQQKSSVKPSLPEDYDIRTDKNAVETLIGFRQSANRDSVSIADARDKFVAAETELRQTVPTLKVEYNQELGNPGLIAPDVLQGRAFLTQPSGQKRVEILRDFLRDNSNLIGMRGEQINNLKVTADYTNPNGELSFVDLEQFIGDVPVFRSTVRAGFNKQNAMFRIVNNSATDVDANSVSKEFGSPADAILRAAGYLNYTLKQTKLDEAASTDLKAVFGSGSSATTAEKMYFPTDIGVARPAWRVLVWETGDAFYVIVDAETGAMLYRENIVHDQTQAATYNVYATETNILKTLPNPAPLPAPGLLDPSLGTQGTLVPRTNVTLIGNEAPNTFNNLGWITDNTNGVNGNTSGNNTIAGVDRDTTNGYDSLVSGTNRVFNFSYTPGAGPNNSGGDSPLLPAYQNGIVTNLFYVTNRYHDVTYPLGFTEAARNFQNDNFNRGGAGNDRVLAEAQDNTASANCTPPCFNNANFATPADGSSGRMQMYLWNLMTPNRDGDLDAEIIVHELTHGTFGRLHTGAISNTQAGQMNEGNSDFFAHVMLSNFTDPINTVSTTGAYSTLNLRTAAPFSSTGNYYYGIRRFPKAVLAFTGGPNNRPHNPLTYKDIDTAQMSLTDGAFAPAFAGSATAVHDGGEIWSSFMWEVRARLVQRLGVEAGNKKVLQLAMDGMKIAPSSPTMLTERNAIISAAQANGNASDIGDIWAGFALRGLGFSATNPTGNTVTESYDLPNAILAQTGFSVSDPAPGGDGDGVPEPGETVLLTVPVSNNTGNTVNNVTASVVGGGNANYGSIANAQTVSRQISYTIPANAQCGSIISVTINVSSELGSQAPQTRDIQLGAPISGGLTENFDGVTAPALPSGWTQTLTGTNTGFVTATGTADTAPNSMRTNNPATAGGSDLESPEFTVTSASAVLNFRNNYNTEATYDGGVLEIKIGSGGTYADIITAGGTWISGGYNSGVRGTNNPLGTRPAWSGNSNGYITTSVRLPASANGQTVRLKWRMGHDNAVAGTAWNIDSVSMINGYTCSFTTAVNKVRADFDGDGKTDFSVFRPTDGNWYINQSTAGFTAKLWGANGDKLMPADYDGDGKTDVAVMRPNANNTAVIFYIMNSGNSTASYVQWGAPSDVPAIADYNGDGKADVAVFRPSTGEWFVLNSGGAASAVTFGQNGDVPVAGDYDGDGKADIAVFRPSNGFWYINKSTGGVQTTLFGMSSDKPVPADYDGDGKMNIAVYRPSNGTWYTSQNSATNFGAVVFGTSTDVPVPGDYDGDGKYDVAVYRNGTWFVNRASGGLLTTTFGASSDAPIPKQYIP